MSLISGSNSLTPVIAGVLDLRVAMVEKALLEEGTECDFAVSNRCDGVFVRAFALKQREKALCCCSRGMGVRLTVLSKEDMSKGVKAQNIAVREMNESKSIG